MMSSLYTFDMEGESDAVRASSEASGEIERRRRVAEADPLNQAPKLSQYLAAKLQEAFALHPPERVQAVLSSPSLPPPRQEALSQLLRGEEPPPLEYDDY